MKVVHQCQTTIGWQAVPVRSSDGSRTYTVHVNPWKNVDENLCECKAYMYHGKCRHQKLAFDKVCGWHGIVGPEQQTHDQRKIGICPRCLGPTIRQVYDE